MKITGEISPKVLEDLFFLELEEIYDGEYRIAKLLSIAVEAASCWNLKKAGLAHLLETENHVINLERVFQCFSRNPTGTTSSITVGLAGECEKVAEDFGGTPAINAALISLLRKVEHYEIAAYTSLRGWALLLGGRGPADILDEILAEENSADELWAALARSTCDEEAIGDASGGESHTATHAASRTGV